MEIIEANDQNFDEVIQNKEVLVDFYAEWCGPCKMVAPELEAIKDKIQIVKINIDENMMLCKRYGVMSVPTLVHITGELADKKIGYMPKEIILDWIGK